jgi:hypothetical protein
MIDGAGPLSSDHTSVAERFGKRTAECQDVAALNTSAVVLDIGVGKTTVTAQKSGTRFGGGTVELKRRDW